jgi:hypothetical protein
MSKPGATGDVLPSGCAAWCNADARADNLTLGPGILLPKGEPTLTQPPEPTDPAIEQSALEALLDLADLSRKAPQSIRLTNGIELRIKHVPPMLLRRVQASIKQPPIPTVWIESRQRDEENPDDPEYLAALEGLHTVRLLADQKARLALGTELISIPEGIEGPDGDGWIDGLRAVGVEPRIDTKALRYIEWLQLYAMVEHIDQAVVQAACFAATGILEPEVLEAINSFRSSAPRRADNVVAPAAPTGDGDQLRDGESVDSP